MADIEEITIKPEPIDCTQLFKFEEITIKSENIEQFNDENVQTEFYPDSNNYSTIEPLQQHRKTINKAVSTSNNRKKYIKIRPKSKTGNFSAATSKTYSKIVNQTSKTSRDVAIQVPHRTEVYNHLFLSIVNKAEYTYMTGFEPFEIRNMLIILKSRNDYSVYEHYVFITLAIYKHKIPLELATRIFSMKEKVIKEIFVICTHTLYAMLKGYDFWTHRLRNPVKYQAIFNCVEVPAVRSENEVYRNLTKSHHGLKQQTFKFLVVTDEKDYVSFCSDVHGGSTSGRQIVLESQILNRLHSGNRILVDKDFIINDFLLQRNIGMDVALFVNSKSPCFLMRAYKIAKSYDILNQPIEENLWCLANRIIYNCYLLYNFKHGQFWFKKYSSKSSALNDYLTMNLINNK